MLPRQDTIANLLNDPPALHWSRQELEARFQLIEEIADELDKHQANLTARAKALAYDLSPGVWSQFTEGLLFGGAVITTALTGPPGILAFAIAVGFSSVNALQNKMKDETLARKVMALLERDITECRRTLDKLRHQNTDVRTLLAAKLGQGPL